MLVLAGIGVLMPGPVGAQTTPDRPIAFVNVNVVPMDRERILPNHTVIIRDGLIAEIGPAARVNAPAGVTVIDGAGKYLMPGLADMHVHMAGSRDIQLALLKLYVANGVTTILNARGAPEHLALRAEIARGEVFGPTLLTVGPYVNEPFFTTPDEVERAVVEQKRAGYDFIKMHGDLSREAYARLMAVGRREGIRIIGHAPRTLGLEVTRDITRRHLVDAEPGGVQSHRPADRQSRLDARAPRDALSPAGRA
jgi:urease alpha subunit